MANKKVLKKLEIEHYYSFNIGWANEFEVNVCVTPDIIASRRHRDPILGTFEPRIEGQKFAGFFAGIGCNGYLFLPPEFDPDLVAHETYHLIDYMMDRLGVVNRDGEVMAYHLGWVVGKVSEIYLRISKNAKKVDKRVDTEFEN
jgi:hypothetical protein